MKPRLVPNDADDVGWSREIFGPDPSAWPDPGHRALPDLDLSNP